MIVGSKKDVAAFVAACPEVLETKAAYEEDEPGGFKEIEDEVVALIHGNFLKERPPYGTDWGSWLDDNIEEALNEAIGIVM